MISRRSVIVPSVLSGLLLLGGPCGCVNLTGIGHSSHDHAFIRYWPPPRGTQQTRLAVKDLIDMKGVVTTAGSEFLAKNSPPAKEDAACLSIARHRSDVVFVGKTNLSEFAVAPSGMNDYFGSPINPRTKLRHRIPGGSSSGSAVAIAKGLADVSFATDTLGSIRFPAACCGIVGLKTTNGLISLKGVYPIDAEHQDTVGPMAADIPHTVLGMELLENGFAAKYKAAEALHPSAEGLTVGRVYRSGTDPRVDTAIDNALLRAHFHVVPLSKDFTAKWDQAARDGTTVATASAWLSNQKFASQPGISLRTRAVVAMGRIAYNTGYHQASARRKAWRATLARTFHHVDLIALPTMQQLPPRLPLFRVSPLIEATVLRLQNTEAVSFSGNPALAIPVAVENMDVHHTSLQLVGPRLSEAELLNAGRLVEDSQPPIHKHGLALFTHHQ